MKCEGLQALINQTSIWLNLAFGWILKKSFPSSSVTWKQNWNSESLSCGVFRELRSTKHSSTWNTSAAAAASVTTLVPTETLCCRKRFFRDKRLQDVHPVHPLTVSSPAAGQVQHKEHRHRRKHVYYSTNAGLCCVTVWFNRRIQNDTYHRSSVHVILLTEGANALMCRS